MGKIHRRAKQIWSITRLQIRIDRFSSNMLIALLLLSLPLIVLLLFNIVFLVKSALHPEAAKLSGGFSKEPLFMIRTLFQSFFMLAIYLVSLLFGAHLFRDDWNDRILHHFLLTSLPRWGIVLGKYVAFLCLMVSAATLVLAGIFILAIVPHGFGGFLHVFGNQSGFLMFFQYLAISIMALMAYGAVFLAAGLILKNPNIPGIFFLIWEAIVPYAPISLKPFSISYYLFSMIPEGMSRSASLLRTVSGTASPLWSIIALCLWIGVSLFCASVVLKRKEITYS